MQGKRKTDFRFFVFVFLCVSTQFCSHQSNGYRAPNVAPPDQTPADMRAEPNWKQWLYKGKLGFNPVFAQLEAKLDLRGKIPINAMQFEHRLFAGAIVEVTVFGIPFHIVSSYIKFSARTPNKVSNTDDQTTGEHNTNTPQRRSRSRRLCVTH